MNAVEFTKLNTAQVSTVRELAVSKRQEEYGGSFAEFVDSCLSQTSATFRGFCLEKEAHLIGAFILKCPPSSPGWVPQDGISLHGLKIAQNWQGQGLGHTAAQLIERTAAEGWPKANSLVLTVDEENTKAQSVYRGIGMVEFGDRTRGRLGWELRLIKLFRA